MCAIESVLRAAERPLTKIEVLIAENRISQHVASIDWICGLVMDSCGCALARSVKTAHPRSVLRYL